MATRGRKPAKPEPGPIADSEWVAPDYLTDRGRAVYGWLVGVLREAGRLSRTDPRLIEAYAVNYDLLVTAYEEIKRDGLTVVSDRGNKNPHPLLTAVNQSTQRLKTIITDLGLNPRTYGGAPEPGGDGDDQWGDLLES